MSERESERGIDLVLENGWEVTRRLFGSAAAAATAALVVFRCRAGVARREASREGAGDAARYRRPSERQGEGTGFTGASEKE